MLPMAQKVLFSHHHNTTRETRHIPNTMAHETKQTADHKWETVVDDNVIHTTHSRLSDSSETKIRYPYQACMDKASIVNHHHKMLPLRTGRLRSQHATLDDGHGNQLLVLSWHGDELAAPPAAPLWL